MESVFEGTVGQKIVLEVGVDITAATTKQIKYKKPNGPVQTWDAAEETSTSISYTTIASTDIQGVGIWQLQPYVVTPSWTDHGEIDRLLVKETL